MKNKIVPIFLCAELVCYNMPVFADNSEFNANEAFENYASYDDSQANESWKHYYIVSKSNDDNSKALFSEDKQLTDFIYDSIDINNCGIVVSQKRDNTEYFGLIDDEDYTELLPVKYRYIENYDVTGYIAENTDGRREYYIVKTPIDEVPNNVDYEETDKLYILNSYDDLKKVLESSEAEPELIPIEGIDNCYIMADSSGFYVNIVNEKGEKLTEINFRSVEPQAGKYDTIVVHYTEGMTDSSLGLLREDCKTIVPQNFYSSINFITVNNIVYVEAVSSIDNSSDYYDLNGNKVDKPDENTTSFDTSYSRWAEESIKNAIELGLVPENLQCNYTSKITRQKFCRLAVQTYINKTGNKINMSVKTPFIDVDDAYITTAYNLKIVSGVGNDKFAPDNYITRQEAAVMLNNLASVLNIDNSTPQSEKFIDESYFADWAKSAIYSVAGIKSGDTYVMAGTGNGKFSPWMNYTREQAIATILRLYNCKSKTFRFIDEISYDNYIYFVYNNLYIMRLSKDGKSLETLAAGKNSIKIEKFINNYIYYSEINEKEGYIACIKTDGSDNRVIVKGNNINDFYIGKNNIYYIQNENNINENLVKVDFNGKQELKFNLPENLSILSMDGGLLAENESIVYLSLFEKDQKFSSEQQPNIYEFDFDTITLKKTNIINYKAYSDKAVTDGKYIFYKVTKNYGFSQPISYSSVYKCDIDKSNETDINIVNLSDDDILYPYENCMYTTISDNGNNIASIYSNGGTHKITNYTDYEYMLSILEISDGIIYYKMTGYNNVIICCININGTDNKILYRF